MPHPGYPLMSVLVSILLISGIAIATLTVRLIAASREGYLMGEEYRREGDLERAVAMYEDAIRSYVPGNRYGILALEKLSLMARQATMQGDLSRSLYLWEVSRRAVLSVRHVVQPHVRWLENAEEQIQRLHQLRKADTADAHLFLPERPPDPSPLLSLVLFAGVVAWIGGAVGFLMIPVRRRGWISAGVSVTGLVTWLAMAAVV